MADAYRPFDVGGEQEFIVTGPPIKTRDRRATAEARRLKMAFCGKVVSRLNPISGLLDHWTCHCDFFTECPRCLAYRVAQEKQPILDLAKTRSIEFVILPTADATAFVQSLHGRENYRKLPLADDTAAVFYLSEGTPGLHSVDPINWELIVNTPVGRNVSGTLGRTKPPTTTDSMYHCTVPIYHFPDGQNATSHDVNDAELKAIAETHYLDPSNSDDLQAAIFARDAATRRQFIANHINFETTYMHVSGKTITIDWQYWLYSDKYGALIAGGYITQEQLNRSRRRLSDYRYMECHHEMQKHHYFANLMQEMAV